MGYMNFKEPMLEKVFKSFKWARNNTIQLFECANKAGILDIKSHTSKGVRPQPLLFQFQCILTTTDTYFRKLAGSDEKSFGILIDNDETWEKEKIPQGVAVYLLKTQANQLQKLLSGFDHVMMAKEIDTIIQISNHEYLHQGQIISYFRENDIPLPERFKKAWAL